MCLAPRQLQESATWFRVQGSGFWVEVKRAWRGARRSSLLTPLSSHRPLLPRCLLLYHQLSSFSPLHPLLFVSSSSPLRLLFLLPYSPLTLLLLSHHLSSYSPLTLEPRVLCAREVEARFLSWRQAKGRHEKQESAVQTYTQPTHIHTAPAIQGAP